MVFLNNKNPWLVILNQPDIALYGLVCCHYGGGSATAFRGWEKDLPDGVLLIGIQLPGRESRFSETHISSLSLIVEQLSSALLPFINIPYILFGHSIGGLICFELARALRKVSLPLPKCLIISATNAPQKLMVREHISDKSDEEFINCLRLYNGLPDELVVDQQMMSIFIPMLRADLQILETYQYEEKMPLNCKLVVLGGLNDPNVPLEDIAAWCIHTNFSCNIRLFPGNHFFIKSHKKEVLAYLSEVIKSQLSMEFCNVKI